ncbi:MAG TPA: adenine methyltransferase [Gammaproteobacteria bacterium]|nr:adenine methyltransferase [Gammaproteobacteria bacterium]
MKSLLRYPGGKTRALKHIVPYFPPNLTTLVSPFFGGGSIEIHYASQGTRVYGYDNFEPLVNFWQNVLKQPEEIAYMLEMFFHPCTKEMFKEYQKKQCTQHDDARLLSWREYRACMFYALNRSSFSGATLCGGYSQQAADNRFTESSIERLRKFKCPNLSVEEADFTKSLARHDDGEFIYADPPYLLTGTALYGDRGNTHRSFDHLGFAETIKQKENWIISYNPAPEILELYKDYEIVYPEWSYGMSKDKKSKEILILNVKENDNALLVDD